MNRKGSMLNYFFYAFDKSPNDYYLFIKSPFGSDIFLTFYSSNFFYSKVIKVENGKPSKFFATLILVETQY